MKPYNVTQHAIERAVERLGKRKDYARNELVQLMQTAVYTGSTPQGRVFDHYKTRTRLVVCRDTDTIITVYSMDVPKEAESVAIVTETNPLMQKARDYLAKELRKAKRQYTRESRKLAEQVALLNVEAARLALNHARCRQPLTRQAIQAKIDAIKAEAIAKEKQAEEMAEGLRKQAEDVRKYFGLEAVV